MYLNIIKGYKQLLCQIPGVSGSRRVDEYRRGTRYEARYGSVLCPADGDDDDKRKSYFFVNLEIILPIPAFS